MSENNTESDKVHIEEFVAWVKGNKALPNNLGELIERPNHSFVYNKHLLSDTILLHRYLKVYDYSDLKRSQELLLHNFSLRKSAPYIFTNRDVFAEEIQRAMKTM